ncbi:MAG: cytidine deaminase [Bradymonadales bacterium]|nr:cytidine deaminase [Bradymonadales bacterium]
MDSKKERKTTIAGPGASASPLPPGGAHPDPTGPTRPEKPSPGEPATEPPSGATPPAGRGADADRSFLALEQAARACQQNAYSNYSRFSVGAAVRAGSGKIYAGCNVENSSYGATMCAERVAIYTAVADGERRIQEVYVLTDESDPWPPCGLCRQVIAEFATQDCLVHLANLEGVKCTILFSDLFPLAFTPDRLT